MEESNATPICQDNTVQIANAPGLWTRIVAAASLFVGLDYDGTIAPFHIDPMQARPLPGIPELIGSLNGRCDTTVAIISGRPIDEILILLGSLGITLVGCHGLEMLDSSGTYTLKRPTTEQEAGLRKARKSAALAGHSKRVEFKAGSIAFHTRGMPADEASRLEQLMMKSWQEVASQHQLRCRKFKGGVEIYSAGRHKGDVLAELVDGQNKDGLCLYIGDDATDEDAFRWIRERGVGIRVGSWSNATAATHFLADCEGVRTFLKALLSLRTCKVH